MANIKFKYICGCIMFFKAFFFFFCRIRPISQLEKERNDKSIIQFPGDGGLWVGT